MRKNEHPIITQMKIEYKNPEKSYHNWNLVQPVYNKGVVKISVSKKMIIRTIEFLNSLLNKIEENGGKIIRNNDFVEIELNEEIVKISCREQTKRIKNTNKEYKWYEYELTPTGVLILQTEILGQREWKDGKLKIEERIDEIIEYCKEKTTILKQIHEKYERDKRKEEIIRWFQLRKQKQVEDEILNIRELFENSNRHQKTKILKDFIDEYENNINKTNEKSVQKLEWMKNIYEWYNPLINKEIELLKEVDRETLELSTKYKDYLYDKHISINEGNEDEMIKELNEILLKESINSEINL